MGTLVAIDGPARLVPDLGRWLDEDRDLLLRAIAVSKPRLTCSA